MSSGFTHDSGIHTMSSRRDSGMSDMKTFESQAYRKSNSDCLPVTQNYTRGVSTHSLDKLTGRQLQHVSNDCLAVFAQPMGSLHDLKTSLDAGSKFNDPGGGGFELNSRSGHDYYPSGRSSQLEYIHYQGSTIKYSNWMKV